MDDAPETPDAPDATSGEPAPDDSTDEQSGDVRDVDTDDAFPAMLTEPAMASAIPDVAPVPTYSEFMVIAMQARMLADSDIAPVAFRGKPSVAFHVGLIGRDLGLSLSAALELVDVIDGRPSLSPLLRSGQIKRLGLGSLHPWVRDVDRCVMYAVGPRGMDRRCLLRHEHVDGCECDIIGVTEFTWEDAQVAGLVRDDCEPTRHSDACNEAAAARDKIRRQAACKQNYRTYPRRMLHWRAAGFCADDYFPEASLGLYSPEELGAITDGDGNVIDVDSVELPSGYEERRRGGSRQQTKVTEAVGEELRSRANSLPGPAIKEFKAMLRERDIDTFPDIVASKEQTVRAMLDSLVTRASNGEWGDWTPPTAPDTSSDDTDDDNAPETPNTEPDHDDNAPVDAVVLCNDCREDPCVCDAAAEALPQLGPGPTNEERDAAIAQEVRIANIADNVNRMTDSAIADMPSGDLFDLADYLGLDPDPGLDDSALVGLIAEYRDAPNAG